MDNTQILTHIELLPNEILYKILQHLNTFDLIRFCEAFPKYEYFFEEKKLINKLNFSKQYGVVNFSLNSFFAKKIRCDYVKVLNISYLYWIGASDIRKCIKRLINLEELYILGTKVGISVKDVESYSKLKLRKLAVTVEGKDLTRSCGKYFPHIRCLCVQIVTKNDHTFQFKLQCVLKDLPKLEELWIYDITDDYPLDYDHLAYTVNSLNKFAFKALCSMFSDLRFTGLTKVFFNERTGREAYYERIESKVTNDGETKQGCGWDILNELHSENPFGLHDAKKLAHNISTLENIYFEELNFMHYANRCCPRYIAAIEDILASKNSRHVRKLSLTNCLFAHDEAYTSTRELSKRPIRYEPISATQNYKHVIDNLVDIEELEIHVCSRICKFEIYYFIPYFRHIRQLSLEIPAHFDGKFLKNLFENCTKLESLKINLVVSNETFNHNFYRYIKLAKDLKNLRYEHYRISMDNMFDGLSGMNNFKMERLYLKCKSMDKFSVASLKRFLELNPQLVFVVIVINSATDAIIKTMQDTLKLFKKSKEKVFMAKKNEKVYSGSFPIPDFHKFELMSPHTRVSIINVFEDFYES